MKPRHIAAAVLFSFLPVTVSLPAWTQEDALTLQARARFKEGVEAFDKGRFEEARLSFLQAYTLKKHPAVLLNLAQSSAKSNHNLDAAKYFQQFLKEATTATPQQRRDAETGLNEVRQKLGRIEVIAPPGTDIMLDDQGKIGTTPMDTIDVEPGQHTVKSPTQSATVIAVVGQKVEAKLTPASAATPPPAAAPVVIPANPPPQETPPPEPPQVDGTVHTSSTNLLSPPKTMAPVWLGLTLGGLGFVSAGIFAWFRSDAQTHADEVEQKIISAAKTRGIPTIGACNNAAAATDFAGPCATLRDNNSKVDTNATVANVSLVLGGVGLVFAGAWYLFAPKRAEAPTTTGQATQKPFVLPYLGPGAGGLVGQF